MNKFQNKYLIPSIRFNVWDYSRGGKYYVTIVTRGRECFFGDITNGKMHLNDIGTIVNDFWLQIPKHFENTWLDEYVIMPNHIHGIIVLKRNVSVRGAADRNVPDRNVPDRNVPDRNVSDRYVETPNLGVFMYRKFGWQSRFYDEIIRNEKRLEQIRKYIQNNPANWKSDDFHI